MGTSEPELSNATVMRPSGSGMTDDYASTPNALSKQQLAAALVQHLPRVWRVARRMGLSPATAEEAAQDAFVILFQKMDRIEPGKELAFLLSTVTLICQNLRRKSSFCREVVQPPELLELVADGKTVLDLVEEKQAKELVDEILGQLSEPLRVVFVFYELERLTLVEISEILEIPLGTAGSRLRLARKAFRNELTRRKKRKLPREEEP